MRYDDDAGLVKAVLDGDKDAFVFLVERYQGAVYAYCLNQVPSEEDAKDTTQEVLLKAYLNLGQLKTPHAFRSWLYTIASNECRMWHRRHQAHESLEAAAEMATTTHGSDLETRLTVKEEIDALPESQRLVILMHYFSGFTLKEIGEFLGTSREAIKARLFRARQKLEMRLKSTFEEYFGSSSKPNFCIPILDKIASLPKPKPSGSNTPVSKAHWLAPLPLATILSVMLLGGLSGLFPTGTDSGPSQAEAINVSLLDADPVLEVAQADTQKKRIDVPTKQVEPGEQRDVGSKISTTSMQVIGSGRVDDIITSLDGEWLVLLTPFGLELHRPDGNQPPITVDTAGEIKSPTFSRDGRFLVWHDRKQLKLWDVEKQEMVGAHSFRMKFLFHIGAEFKADLDNQIISDDLQNVFAEHGLRLSYTIRFSYSGPDAPRLPNQVNWVFVDRGTFRTYGIREEGDKLGVYAHPGTGWNFILDAALHPEMKDVAVALPLNEIMFIDPVSGDWLRSFEWETQGSAIQGMQYSPDGRQLVIFKSGSKYGQNPHQFFFLNPQDGEILHKFDIPCETPEIMTFAYSPESQWFAFRAWTERRVDVINTTDWQGKKTFKVKGGTSREASITFSPDGHYLALGDTVWDFQTGEPVHVGVYRAISQFLDNTRLLISDWKSVKMWDVLQNKLSQETMIKQGISSWDAYFLPDDDTILNISESLSLWKASTGGIIQNGIVLKDFYPRISAVSPVSYHVAAPSTSKREVRIWDTTKRAVIHRIPIRGERPYALAFSPDGKKLAVGEGSYTASLWDISTANEVHRFVNFVNTAISVFRRNDQSMVRALAFSPDGKQLACGVFNAIRLWDVKTGKPSQKLVLPTDLPQLDVKGQPVKRLKTDGPQDIPNTPMFLQFSKDGKRLFAGLASGHFVVFNIASGTVVKTLLPGYLPKTPEFDYPISVALNPDTLLMAVGRTDHVIELIDTQTWQSVAELKGHRGQISSLDFSHDGKQLLSTSGDGTMRIWEIEDL